MSATTGAVVSSVVAMQAAQNERLEKQRCQFVLETYDPVYAETEGMRDYAYCVQKLYPEPITEGENMIIKGCILILLVSLVVGAIYGYKNSHGDWEDACLWAMLAPMLICLFMGVIGLICLGVGFLFT